MIGEGNQISAPYSDLKRTHGILNAVGWGVLLLIGAMIARYFKDVHKSYWFYAHVSIQLSGFIIGLAGIITGLVLNDRIDVNVAKHKAIGLIVVTLGCLQVCVLLICFHIILYVLLQKICSCPHDIWAYSRYDQSCNHQSTQA